MTENLSVLQPVETALSVPTPAQFSTSLAEAQAKAQSLKAMISANKWSVDIRGSEHIRVEAWITLASGYGCTAQIVEGSVRRLEGHDRAFEARAEVLRSTPTGRVRHRGRRHLGARPGSICRAFDGPDPCHLQGDQLGLPLGRCAGRLLWYTCRGNTP